MLHLYPLFCRRCTFDTESSKPTTIEKIRLQASCWCIASNGLISNNIISFRATLVTLVVSIAGYFCLLSSSFMCRFFWAQLQKLDKFCMMMNGVVVEQCGKDVCMDAGFIYINISSLQMSFLGGTHRKWVQYLICFLMLYFHHFIYL